MPTPIESREARKCFLKFLDEQIQLLESSSNALDLEKVAHSVAGSAGHLGLWRLGQIAEKMENLASEAGDEGRRGFHNCLSGYRRKLGRSPSILLFDLSNKEREVWYKIQRGLGTRVMESSSPEELPGICAEEAVDLVILSGNCNEETFPERIGQLHNLFLGSRPAFALMATDGAHRFSTSTTSRVELFFRGPVFNLSGMKSQVQRLLESGNVDVNPDQGNQPPIVPGSSKIYRVLYAEDSQPITNFVKRHLTLRGYQVFSSERVQQATELLCNLRFDLAILDYRLPDGTGMDVMEALKKTCPEGRPPVVMLTAARDEKVVFSCLQGGVDRYILKPLKPNTLFSTIKELLGERPSLSGSSKSMAGNSH